MRCCKWNDRVKTDKAETSPQVTSPVNWSEKKMALEACSSCFPPAKGSNRHAQRMANNKRLVGHLRSIA